MITKTLIVFKDTPKRGDCLYQGISCPTIGAYKNLGFRGLFQVHTKIQDEVNMYARIKSDGEDYGLESTAQFREAFSKKVFQVVDKTDRNFDDWISYYQAKGELQFPEILEDEEDFYLVREISGEVDDFTEIWGIIHGI